MRTSPQADEQETDVARDGEHARLPELRARIAAASSVEEACEAVSQGLAATGLLLSVYLQQGERLRCRAVDGYWQIFDGMLDAGVIGSTFRTGRRTLVRAAAAHPDYLEAAPDVADELCVPLRVGGAVVGVVNAEATATLSDEHERLVDEAAALLEQRLELLGLPPESPAQKLGRHAAALSTLAATVDGPLLLQAVVAAAVDISGMESAALYLEDGGHLAVQAACGPFADRLRTLPAAQLARMAAWVETGTSSYTVGRVDGLGFPGHEELRTSGAGSLIVLPSTGPDGRRGMLLVTTEQIRPLRTDEVQLLELLTAVVTSCLQIADSVRALRLRAEADALTGLGHHASFHATLPRARRAASARRLAVLYVDVDHFKAVNDTRGHAAGDELLLTLSRCMTTALRDGDRLFRIGGDEFAALARVSDEEQALALGRRLLETVRAGTGSTLSVGVAVEQEGESDASLLARADDAVYTAKASGRATVHLAPPGPRPLPVPRAVQKRGGSV